MIVRPRKNSHESQIKSGRLRPKTDKRSAVRVVRCAECLKICCSQLKVSFLWSEVKVQIRKKQHAVGPGTKTAVRSAVFGSVHFTGLQWGGNFWKSRTAIVDTHTCGIPRQGVLIFLKRHLLNHLLAFVDSANLKVHRCTVCRCKLSLVIYGHLYCVQSISRSCVCFSNGACHVCTPCDRICIYAIHEPQLPNQGTRFPQVIRDGHAIHIAEATMAKEM